MDQDLLTRKKKSVLLSIMKFLADEIATSNLTEEKKESLEVAMQCIETAYDINSETKEKLDKYTVNLLSATNVLSGEDASKVEKAAEEHKNAGNVAMKNSCYEEAIKEYSKAITLNPTNAVYYCNRAAAYSRLEKHHEAIGDCKEAIRLEPTYGKAYGRLGIAYSGLNMLAEAKKAYETAVLYDPNNSLYESNLKLVQEQLNSSAPNAASNPGMPIDFTQIINNESFTNMAMEMLNNPEFSTMMSRLVSMGQTGDINFSTLLQAGQNLASQMENTDPSFVENLRRTFNQQNQQQSQNAESNQNPSNNENNADGSNKNNDPRV